MSSLSFPPWLKQLMREASWDHPYVEMIELGGRGVKHPYLGWITVEELRDLAE